MKNMKKRIVLQYTSVLLLISILFSIPISAEGTTLINQSNSILMATSSTTDPMVLATQQWLNSTYGDFFNNYNASNCYTKVEENGKTGSATMKALVTALQIELHVSITADTAGSFGSLTMAAFNALPNLQKQPDGSSKTNLNKILQGALWCKGYGIGVYQLTGNFYSGTENAVKNMQADAGITQDGIVTGKVMKSLLTTDAYVKLKSGNTTIRQLQQELNQKYSDVHSGNTYLFGIMPCDGIFSRATSKALIYHLQITEGLAPYPTTANGNFGPTTKSLCPIINTDTANAKTEYVRILQYALLWNGYDPGRFDGIYDANMKNAVNQFQEFCALPITGIIDTATWSSLFISYGDKARKGKALDCSTILDATKAQKLKSLGFGYVGRYLTGTVGGTTSKALTANEISTIFSVGLKIFPIYQDGGYTETYFSAEQGWLDAAKAVKAARNLKIPFNTVIYFAVDYDFTDEQVTSKIVPYFESIYHYFGELSDSNSTINPGNSTLKYKIGVYGSRNICKRVSNAGYAVSSFVSDMSSGFSGNIGYSLPTNWAFDQFFNSSIDGSINPIYQQVLGFEIDTDIVSGRDKGFDHLQAEEYSGFKIVTENINNYQTYDSIIEDTIATSESRYNTYIPTGQEDIKRLNDIKTRAIKTVLGGCVAGVIPIGDVSADWFNNLPEYLQVLVQKDKMYDAALLLGNFLNGAGGQYEIAFNWLLKDNRIARVLRSQHINELFDYAENNITSNSTVNLGTEYYYIPLDDVYDHGITNIFSLRSPEYYGMNSTDYTKNWWYAVGQAHGWMTAVVNKNGNNYTADITYHIRDFYDWTPGAVIGGGLVTDGEMAELHAAGMAREFEVVGECHYTVSWTAGERVATDTGSAGIIIDR